MSIRSKAAIQLVEDALDIVVEPFTPTDWRKTRGMIRDLLVVLKDIDQRVEELEKHVNMLHEEIRISAHKS